MAGETGSDEDTYLENVMRARRRTSYDIIAALATGPIPESLKLYVILELRQLTKNLILPDVHIPPGAEFSSPSMAPEPLRLRTELEMNAVGVPLGSLTHRDYAWMKMRESQTCLPIVVDVLSSAIESKDTSSAEPASRIQKYFYMYYGTKTGKILTAEARQNAWENALSGPLISETIVEFLDADIRGGTWAKSWVESWTRTWDEFERKIAADIGQETWNILKAKTRFWENLQGMIRGRYVLRTGQGAS